ncbi:MAG: hypothetical protein WCG15_01345 [Actinomycetes bacterium]
MALTQDQVNWWFNQNPTANPEDIAAAVKTAGGLEANPGLSGMIADRYKIPEQQVTDYYTNYATPTTGALSQVSGITPPVTGALTQAATSTTATTLPEDINAKLKKQLADQRASLGLTWQSGLDLDTTTAYMADDLRKSGITDISQVGQKTVTVPASQNWEGGMDGQMVETPETSKTVYYNKITGEPLQSGYGERTSGNAYSGTYSGEGNTAFRVQMDPSGNPVFYTTKASSQDQAITDLMPLAAMALNFVPGIGTAIGSTVLSSLGITGASAAITSAVGNLVTQTVLNGGDLPKALTNVAANYLGGQVAGSEFVQNAIGDLPNKLQDTLTGAIAGGTSAAVKGQNIGIGALTGGGAAAASSFASDYLKDTSLTPQQQKSLSTGASTFVAAKLAGATTQDAFNAAALASGSAAAKQVVNDAKAGKVAGVEDDINVDSLVNDFSTKFAQIQGQPTTDTASLGAQVQMPGWLNLKEGESVTGTRPGPEGETRYTITRPNPSDPENPFTYEAYKDPVSGQIYSEFGGPDQAENPTAMYITASKGMPDFADVGAAAATALGGNAAGSKNLGAQEGSKATETAEGTPTKATESGAKTGTEGTSTSTTAGPGGVTSGPGGVTNGPGTTAGPGTLTTISSSNNNNTGSNTNQTVLTNPLSTVVTNNNASSNLNNNSNLNVNANPNVNANIVTTTDTTIVPPGTTVIPPGTTDTTTTDTTTDPTKVTDPTKTTLPKVTTPTKQPTTSGALGSVSTPSSSGAIPGTLTATMLAGAPLKEYSGMTSLTQLYPQLAHIDPKLLQILSGRANAAAISADSTDEGTRLMAGVSGKPSPNSPMSGNDNSTSMPTYSDQSMIPNLDTGNTTAAGLKYLNGGALAGYAKGGPVDHIPEFITGKTGNYVQGAGDGQSDSIPAMLADGEYVFDADTVAALGNGSNKAGALVLDKMRQSIREHKRSAPVGKIPPKAKSPLSYMKGIK